MAQWLRAVALHEWLLLSALLWFADRYFWLMDDSFIYFRYVANFVFLGRGLGYNPGEYVEAYSSPLWTLLLIGLRSLDVSYWPLLRGATAGFALLFGLLSIGIDRLSGPSGRPRVNLPLAVAAGHYGVQAHLSSGLETPLVQLGAAVFALACLRPHSRLLRILLALLPLVRPELALACVVYAVYWTVRVRRFPWLLACAGVLFNGGWLLFRIYYYADFWPNTYHVKGLTNWVQGGFYLRNVVATHHLWFVVPALALLALVKRGSLRGTLGPRFCMLIATLVISLWVARVGGDMLYYRYLAFPFCLLLFACAGILETLLGSTPTRSSRVAAAGMSLALGVGSLLCYPPQFRGHPLTRPKTGHYHAIAEADWHRRHPQLRYSDKNIRLERAQRRAYDTATEDQKGARKAEQHPWCRRGYTDWDHHVINSYGLTDAVLARIDIRPTRPGHKPLGLHAQHLARIYRRNPDSRRPGMLRREVERKRAPAWIKDQLPKLELLERKIFNQHDLAENWALARATQFRLRSKP